MSDIAEDRRRLQQLSQKLDVAKMEAAFKRAAHKALYGTREERSERFLPRREALPTSDSDNDASKETDSVERKA